MFAFYRKAFFSEDLSLENLLCRLNPSSPKAMKKFSLYAKAAVIPG